MAKLKLRTTILSKLSTLARSEGNLVITRDGETLYFDTDTKRFKISDFIDVADDNDRLAILAPNTEKMYYVLSTNAVWRYISGTWYEVTSTEDVSDILSSLSNKADSNKAYLIDDSNGTDVVDDDYIPFYDTSASAKKKSTFSNFVAKIKAKLITDTYSGTSTSGMSGKAVKSAIDALDGNLNNTTPSASKTLTAFSQTDGKVSATFGDINISKSQINDFPTIPTVNNATLTIQKNGINVQTFTANASSNKTANITVPTTQADLTEVRLTNEDLNDVTYPGFYYAGGGNTVTNKPTGYNNFGLVVIHNAAQSQYTQVISNENGSYRRIKKADGTWTSWAEDKFTDTTYTAGTNVSIDANNAISATDENVKQEKSTSTSYFPILFANSTNDSSEAAKVQKNMGLTIRPSTANLVLCRENTGTSNVTNTLTIGNNIADGTTGSVRGCLRLYSKGAGCINLYSEETSTDLSYFLPKDKSNNAVLAVTEDTAVALKLASDADLNDIKTVGFYYAPSGNSITNKPTGFNQFGLIVVRSATSANYYKQIMIRPNTDGEEWTRTCTNGTWSSWVKSEFTDTTYSFADGTNEFTVTPSDTGTASTIKVTPQLKIDGITSDTTDKEINCYGECSTAAGTAAKTVSITKGTFALAAGSKVIVKFTNANTANNPTLNVNSKGAKNIFHNGARITTGANKALLAGTIEFVYDGTQFQLVGNYIDSNTEYTVNTSTGLSMSNNQIAIDKVPIENGGTNATTRLAALKNLTNQSVATPNYFFGMTTSWATGGYVSIANSTKVLKQSLSCISLNDSAITTSNRWHKVAEVTATTANVDYGIMLSVCNTFTSNTVEKENSCILVAHVRMAAVGTHQSASLKIIANGGFSADQFKLMYKATASTNVKYEIWTDIDTRYMGRRFTVMNEGIRTDAFANSWTLNNSTSGGDLPSGYVTVNCVDETAWKQFDNGTVILCKTSKELMSDTCTDMYFKIVGMNRVYSFQLPMSALNQTSDSADFQMTVGYYKSTSNNENITFRLWHNSNKVKIRCVEAIQNGTSVDADVIGFYAYYKG